MADGKLVDFIKMWRQHFIDSMKPAELPYFWKHCPESYAALGIERPKYEKNYRRVSEMPHYYQKTPDSPII